MSKLQATINHFEDYISRGVFKKQRMKKMRGFMRKKRQAERWWANRGPIQWHKYEL